MDLAALQSTLRQFAAERDWQAFHTPKNLAMALMVEAAELAEIFQWMSPDESLAARADPAVRERIADEVADVLLYLLQIADHTGLDLARAVGSKLVKNARKHPPKRPARSAEAAAGPLERTHVLVDWENVQPSEAELRAAVPQATDVWLFHGPQQKDPLPKHAGFGARAKAVRVVRTGKNALDFHLSFYLGGIASAHKEARVVVLANDKGYGSLLEHVQGLGFSAIQVGFTKAAAKKKAVPEKPAPAPAPPPAPVTAPAPAPAPSKKTKSPAKKAAVAHPGQAELPFDPPKPAPLPSKRAGPRTLAAAVRHVQACLQKTDGRPTREAKLRSTIRALLDLPPDDPQIDDVLSQLVESRAVLVDEKGRLSYGQPPG